MTIYIYGCSTCGVNSIFIRKVQAYALRNGEKVQVLNSRYSGKVRKDHINLLTTAGFDTDKYEPIVVEGNTITRLRTW